MISLTDMTEILNCDLAITNAYILTLDDDFTEFAPGLILIRNGKLVYVGPDQPYAPRYKTTETINARNKLVMPAFFNAHNHAGMSIYRGLGNDLVLDDWLNRFVWPMEAKFATPENVHLGTLLSAMEMIRSGTNIFADMYFFEEEVARAAEEIGMRVILGEGILNFPTPHFDNAEKYFTYLEQMITQYRDHSLVGISISAHAPYTCSDELLKRVSELAAYHQVPATIHLAETQWEYDSYMERYGKTSTQYLADLGFFDHHVVAYHCNYLSETDRQILKQSGSGVATITHSNMKLASGVCPVKDLMNWGIPVAIGTDGPASNNNQSVLMDMRSSVLLQKTIEKDPTVLDTHTAIRMATSNGAKAYRMENQLGSLEIGKQADLIMIDTDQPHWQPMHDVYASIVYAMLPSDVETVIVNGRVIMKDRELLQVDEKKILHQVKTLMKKMNQ